MHACMPVYLGISCVKGGRGETRGGGGGRADKEVESSTTLAGVTLEEPEQMLLGRNTREGRPDGQPSFKSGALTQLENGSHGQPNVQRQ